MGYASGRLFSGLGETLMGLPDRKRQAEEDARRRQQEDLERAVWMAEKNVQTGPMPTRQRTLVGTVPGLDGTDVDLGSSALFPEPSMLEPWQRRAAEEFMPVPAAAGLDTSPLFQTDRIAEPMGLRPPDVAPRAPARAPVTLTEPDARYRKVGESQYMEAPGVAEDRETLMAEDRARRVAREYAPGQDPDVVADARAENVPWSTIAPEPEEPIMLEGPGGQPFENTPEGAKARLAAVTADAEARREGDAGGLPARATPTYAQALDEIRRMYWVEGTENPPRYNMPESEMRSLAQQRAAGAGVEVLPNPETITRDRADVPGAMAGYPPAAVERVSRAQRPAAAAPAPSVPAPAAAPAAAAAPAPAQSQQHLWWDEAAAILTARGEDPVLKLGPRPK